LKYLARYTYRVAISNDRIESLTDGQVTFRYKAYAHGHRWRRMTLPAHEFLRRFMCHVLPRGFVRIRSFGFLASRVRDDNWHSAGNCSKSQNGPRPQPPPIPLLSRRRMTVSTAAPTAAGAFCNWSGTRCGRVSRNW
jgi:hypothetical protein